MWRALKHRDYALYATAGFVSNVGLWFQRVGVQWLVWSLTGSYAWLGAIALAEAITIMLLLPISGTFTDRVNRLFLGRIAQLLLMMLVGALATLTILDLITVWGLLVFMILHGAAESLWTPIRMAMAPNLVPREDLSSAIGLGSILFNLAQFIGPALAGILIASFSSDQVGIGWLFAINSLSFLAYFAVLFMITLRSDETRAGERRAFLADFKEGLVYVVQKQGLGLFMLFMIASMMVLRSYRELLAGLADGVFLQGPEGFGILQSAAGLGAIFGSLMIAKLSNVSGLTKAIFIASFIGVLFQLGLAITDTFWLAVLCVAGMSCFGAYLGIGGQLLVQSAIHGSLRGRVMSLWSMILRGGPATGAWTVGMISGLWHIQLVLAGSAILFLGILIAIQPKRRHLADSLEAPPD